MSVLLVVLLAAPAVGQDRTSPVSLEARGGYTLPVGSLENRGAQSDFGYGVGLTLGVSPAFGVYGGWGRDIFHCEQCVGDQRLQASGFELGGKFVVPNRSRAHPWARAGVLVSRSLLRTDGARFESDRHLGFQGALGLDAPLGDAVSLSPAVRFNSFRSEWDGLDGTTAGFGPRTDFRYLSFDVSLLIHLR